MTRLDALLAGEGPVIIDGATGTECERRGVPVLANAWSVGGARTHPDVIREANSDHIAAGAEVIIANTFPIHRHVHAAGRPVWVGLTSGRYGVPPTDDTVARLRDGETLSDAIAALDGYDAGAPLEGGAGDRRVLRAPEPSTRGRRGRRCEGRVGVLARSGGLRRGPAPHRAAPRTTRRRWLPTSATRRRCAAGLPGSRPRRPAAAR